MPPIDPPLPVEHQQRIATAAAELAGAEQDLLTTLEALPSSVRADKRIVSTALQGALEKLATAKRRLEEMLVPRR
jgi:hypothetical protein